MFKGFPKIVMAANLGAHSFFKKPPYTLDVSLTPHSDIRIFILQKNDCIQKSYF